MMKYKVSKGDQKGARLFSYALYHFSPCGRRIRRSARKKLVSGDPWKNTGSIWAGNEAKVKLGRVVFKN